MKYIIRFFYKLKAFYLWKKIEFFQDDLIPINGKDFWGALNAEWNSKFWEYKSK